LASGNQILLLAHPLIAHRIAGKLNGKDDALNTLDGWVPAHNPNLAATHAGPLDGCLLFKKLNCVLATCRRTVLFDAPPLPEFGPNPVKGFEVREVGGQPAFKLIISPKVRWETRSPLEDLMVFATPPRNASVEKENRLFFIGLTPAPVDGECDFTEPYLRKLKEWRKLGGKWYRLPLEGSRVFVRVWQQVNGWQDRRGMFCASALVPDNWDGADRPKPAHWRHNTLILPHK
jgi:hypothetical protein